MYLSPPVTPETSLQCSFCNKSKPCYNKSCSDDDSQSHHETGDGSPHSHKPNHYCYSVWKNDTEGVQVIKKGCISGDKRNLDCSEKSRCVADKLIRDNYFCCCQENLCNQELYYIPSKTSAEIRVSAPPSITSSNIDSKLFLIGGYIMVPILIIFALFVLIKWIHFRKKARYYQDGHRLMNTSADNAEHVPFSGGIHEIKNKPQSYRFLELKSRGRFGTVWKARISDSGDVILEENEGKLVAVKIFPAQEKVSWLTEQQVFMLPQFQHENVLPFLGSQEKFNNCPPYQVEYWIVTEYYELGSLCDYLKSHTIDLKGLLKIMHGIVRGLSHLHEELPPTRIHKQKPAIAHRDFKSRNVLLGSNLCPKIADFGLCLIFENDRVPKELGQVGTRRYMAPEVLEGAISFSKDSLLRIDMYACGLVLWEIISRCKTDDGSIIPDNFMLPFEEEVGQNCSLEDMQEAVCQQKKRPKIKGTWKNHPQLRMICDTIEQCWDQDAEARLSASCVLERFSYMI